MHCWLVERLVWLASAILLAHGQSLEEQIRGYSDYSYPIRLVGSRNAWEGNVEVFFQNEWGSVCDYGWGMEEATVVCRQLGFSGASWYTVGAYFPRTKAHMLLDSVECKGNERELGHCGHDGWGVHFCFRDEAAGVICKKDKHHPIEVFPSINQVVEGQKKFPKVKISSLPRVSDYTYSRRNIGEGQVAVRHNNICKDEWTLREGRVVCRNLGFGGAEKAVTTGHFGISREPILLSGVRCTGYEDSLLDCVADPQIKCSSELSPAEVVCNHNLPDLQIDIPTIRDSVYLDRKNLSILACAGDEGCLASTVDIPIPSNQFHKNRTLLRFSTKTHNVGTADFRPFNKSKDWEWHDCHNHFHSMKVFSHYDVIDRETHLKVAEGHKASFCLEDTACGSRGRKTYRCLGKQDQGISVGCYDEYAHNIDCQWIDITDIRPGKYYLQVIVNPEFQVAELSYENNAIRCDLYYYPSRAVDFRDGAVAKNCHYIRM